MAVSALDCRAPETAFCLPMGNLVSVRGHLYLWRHPNNRLHDQRVDREGRLVSLQPASGIIANRL